MLSVILPLARVKRAVWPAVCPAPVLLVLDVFALIPAALRKDESAIAVLLVIEKLSCVGITTSESDGTKAMHHIVHPIAFVGASLREAGTPVTMLFPIVIVSFVLKLRHLTVENQSL